MGVPTHLRMAVQFLITCMGSYILPVITTFVSAYHKAHPPQKVFDELSVNIWHVFFDVFHHPENRFTADESRSLMGKIIIYSLF